VASRLNGSVVAPAKAVATAARGRVSRKNVRERRTFIFNEDS